ncbi:hypothetical protein [Mangrovibacter phragmitis]|nr:hypothetical protein [Mangrovibacter phragmitis]
MLKVFFRRLQHCNDVASSINQASIAQLHQLKAQLAEQMGFARY